MGISHSVPRVDAAEKSSGETQYVADMQFDGLYYARTLRADRPRAKILSIDIPPLPEGYAIVDRHDVPGKNRIKLLIDDWPFFAEEVVNHVGEPILLVVGPDREVLDHLLAQIVVHYEDVAPILSLEAAGRTERHAERSEASEAHRAAQGAAPRPIYGEDNCFARYELVKGDPDAGFAQAARTIEATYTTGYQEHVYIEPQGFVGTADETGKVTVYGSLQCPYYVKKALLDLLGCGPDGARVVQTTTGGAFGGKEDYPSLLAGHVALAALKTGRPVQLVFDRKEDIEASTKRHPSVFHYRTAFDDSGNILAMEIDVKLNGGAYAGLSAVVLQRAMFASTGVYCIDHVRVRGEVLATNTVPTGAFRGFGAPQAFFAIEMHMEHIARELGREPLEFKMAHALRQGDSTITGGRVWHPVKLPEMLVRLDEMSGYHRKRQAAMESASHACALRGIGASIFFHGCGFTGDGEQNLIKARAKLAKRPGGKVEILIANVEMGQGAQTTLRKVVAERLGIALADVVYDNPDTDRVPDSGPTVASRTVMIVGRLLEQAAMEMEARWDEGEAFEVTVDYRQPEFVKWDQQKLKGDAYPTYAWGANVVEVEVDPVTLEVKVEGAWGVYDVGVPIDEQIVRGQLEGGMAQGLGYATIEVMNMNEGRILQNSLTDYIIPTTKDVPAIETDLVWNPYEDGPFGAKGAGELPLVGVAPALAAAVQHALGISLHDIPVTPEYLLKKLDGTTDERR